MGMRATRGCRSFILRYYTLARFPRITHRSEIYPAACPASAHSLVRAELTKLRAHLSSCNVGEPEYNSCEYNHDEAMVEPPIIVGITGASGVVLAKRCIEELAARERECIVLCTQAGATVWQQEQGAPFKEWVRHVRYVTSYGINDIAAPIASGTYPTAGMVVVPCSMNTLAAMAHGLSGNLLERAVDVTLKEGRPLVVVPRETPLSVIHLRNLLTVAELGVKVVPPMPHFYARPERVEEIVDHIVGRMLVALGVDKALPSTMQYGEGIR